MSRLLIHVEGETEETFVNEVLCPHLMQFQYSSIAAKLIGNARMRDRRGGIKSWPSARTDIVNHLRADRECLTTTMVDYYALPQNGDRAWPGRAEAGRLSFSKKAFTVESALKADIQKTMGTSFNPNRFIPYVMMHEFEAMLFSDCDAFGRGIGRSDLAADFLDVRSSFTTPEEINDSPQTAPSKRVQELVSGYQKPLMGTLAILEIGLDSIRKECPHFAEWLTLLETLPQG